MKDSTRTESPMAKELINGPTGSLMKDNGSMGPNMALAFGKDRMATVTWESGKTEWPKGLECIPGATATSTKASFRKT